MQLTCGETKFTTHCIPKTLNPEWNVICTMPITGVDCLLLEGICWDKDRFGKDYLGEFDLALEEIFADEKTAQMPKWYRLKSKKPGKKASIVSGEVLLQCTLYDTTNKDATDAQIMEKLRSLAASLPESTSRNITPTLTPTLGASPSSSPSPPLIRNNSEGYQDDDDDDEFPIERPRFSLPMMEDDDLDDLKPPRLSGLEEDNYTATSIELPRRAWSEGPLARFDRDRGSLAGSVRFSDYNGPELMRDAPDIDSGFFPPPALDDDDDDGDAVLDEQAMVERYVLFCPFSFSS